MNLPNFSTIGILDLIVMPLLQTTSRSRTRHGRSAGMHAGLTTSRLGKAAARSLHGKITAK